MPATHSIPSIVSPFNAKSTAEEVSSGIDLTGKIALITGGTKGGLGYETARVLALRGAHVFITARDEKKGSEAVNELIKATGNKKIEYLIISLDDLNSVREGLKPFIAKGLPLHILVNNAGINDPFPYGKTKQNFPPLIGINHIAHFYLTQLLLPQLKAAKNARVVVLSSLAARMVDIPAEGEKYEWTSPVTNKEDFLFKKYGLSKLANAYFANEFDRRYNEYGIRAFSVHPGVIATKMFRATPEEELKSFGAILPDGSLADWVKSLEQGAATSVFAAVSPLLNGYGGVFLNDSNIAPITPDSDLFGGAAEFFYNEKEEKKLWEETEKWIAEATA